jgi:hypothetical protein
MAQSHLSTEQLLAFRDGDLTDTNAVEHLAGCRLCQEAFDDTRWTLMLRRLPGIVDAGEHPSMDELLAFRSYAMSSQRVLEIRRHLRSCPRCLAIYGRVRAQDKRAAYSSPSPEMLRRARRRFRPQRIRTLGTLLVTRIGEGLRALFMPEPSLDTPLPRNSMRDARHPGSARRRAAMDYLASESEAPEAARCVSNPIGSGEPQRAARFEVEGRMIEFTPLARARGSYFGVRVRTVAPGISVGGVRIRIVSEDGTKTEAVTDRNGATELAFPPGRSTIRIDATKPVAVKLDFPSSL